MCDRHRIVLTLGGLSAAVAVCGAILLLGIGDELGAPELSAPQLASEIDDSPEPSSIPPQTATALATAAVTLDPIARDASSPLVEIAGNDPLAPRDLILWRIDQRGAAVIARGFSGLNGSVWFPAVAAPRDGMVVAVTNSESPPAGADLAELQFVPARPPGAPQVMVWDVVSIAVGEDEFVLRILPAEATGEVVLADSSSRIFARYRLPEQPFASERALEVAVVLASGEVELLVGHELNGRRSEWRRLELRPDLL